MHVTTPQNTLPAGATIFITGGSGFLGQQIIRDLVAQGYSVRALARSEKAAATVTRQGASVVAGTLDDIAALQRGMQGCAAIIHAAAKVELWGPWDEFFRDTVQGTQHVIEAGQAAGVPRLVHISTEAVLAAGVPLVDVNESTPLPVKPIGNYPKSKGMAETLVRQANSPLMQTVIVRPRFIWGQGDTSLLPQLVDAVRRGQWMWFGDEHPMSTCHVKNVSHGVVLATRQGRGGEIYFLVDDHPVGFREFITRLLRTQGVTPPDRSAPLWLARGMATAAEWVWKTLGIQSEPPLTKTAVNLFFSEVTIKSDKAEKELGYRPVITIEDGLRELASGVA